MVVATILLVGFELFDKYLYNPSEELVLHFNGKHVGGHEIVGIVLPVELRTTTQELQRALKEVMPAATLGLGLHPLAREAILELVATNIYHHKEDMVYLDDRVLKVLPTRLPYERIIRKCRVENSLPIRVSASIGAYLCNTVAYHIHRWAHDHNAIGGFIHVPPHYRLQASHATSHATSFTLLVETIDCVLATIAEELSQRETMAHKKRG